MRLQFQGGYFGLLATAVREHPTAHVVADVSTAQLRTEYDRLVRSDPPFAEAMKERAEANKADSSNGVQKIVSFRRRGTESQRAMAGILCRGFMTHGMRRGGTGEADDGRSKLILAYRNRVLSAARLAKLRHRIFVCFHMMSAFQKKRPAVQPDCVNVKSGGALDRR